MGSRQGPPKHQNKFAWKPNAGVKINETVLKQIIEYLILNSHFWKKKHFTQEKGISYYDRKSAEGLGLCPRLRACAYVVKSRSNGNAVTENTSPSPNLPNGIFFFFFIFIYNILEIVGFQISITSQFELIFVAVNDVPNVPFVRLTIISVLVCVSQSKLLQLKLVVKHVLKFVEICIGIYYQICHLQLCFVLLNTFFFFLC